MLCCVEREHIVVCESLSNNGFILENDQKKDSNPETTHTVRVACVFIIRQINAELALAKLVALNDIQPCSANALYTTVFFFLLISIEFERERILFSVSKLIFGMSHHNPPMVNRHRYQIRSKSDGLVLFLSIYLSTDGLHLSIEYEKRTPKKKQTNERTTRDKNKNKKL